MTTTPDESARVEFLFFGECPNHVVLRQRLDEAVMDLSGDLGGKLRYVAIDMQTLDGSDPRLRWGSPTILVDGRDMFGQEPAAEPSLMCRMYPEGLPSKTEIAARLDAR